MSAGFVYVVRAENGHFKIGASRNPRQRVEAMGTGSPVRLTLLHCIATNAMFWLEKTLHRRYKVVRTEGEWFVLGESDVVELCEMPRWDRAKPPRTGRHAGKEDPLPALFSERLRFHRKRRGLSHGQLAYKVGLDRQHLSKLERGLKLPRLTTFIALADALGVTLDELAGRD